MWRAFEFKPKAFKVVMTAVTPSTEASALGEYLIERTGNLQLDDNFQDSRSTDVELIQKQHTRIIISTHSEVSALAIASSLV